MKITIYTETTLGELYVLSNIFIRLLLIHQRDTMIGGQYGGMSQFTCDIARQQAVGSRAVMRASAARRTARTPTKI